MSVCNVMDYTCFLKVQKSIVVVNVLPTPLIKWVELALPVSE